MKIMQINMVYPFGSTGKIVKDIHSQLLLDGQPSIVCYGRGPRVVDNYVYKIAPEFIMKLQSLQSKITGYAYGGCAYSTNKLLQIIYKEKPSVVHLHCINGYMVNIYRILDYLKENNINTVLTLHAEFMYTAGCGHAFKCEKWKTGCGHCPQRGGGRPSSKLFDRSAEEWEMMKQGFDGFDKISVVAVSEWVYNRAKQSPFFMNKTMSIVHNGIDTKNIFKPSNADALRKKLNIGNRKVILHVTPSFKNPIKGGRFVLEIAEKLKNKNIVFLIVGFDGNCDILPKNVIAIANIKNPNEFAKYYSLADVTLLTSKKETFSMVCAESLACGTPVVGFKAGAPELISIKEYSEFVEYENISALINCVNKWINVKSVYNAEIHLKASKIYSREFMYEQYLSLYKGFLK